MVSGPNFFPKIIKIKGIAQKFYFFQKKKKKIENLQQSNKISP